MSELYLMEREGAQMNVPPDKLDAYLEKGWKILKTPQENKNQVVDQPVAADPVAVETAAAVVHEAIIPEGTAKAIAKRFGKRSK